MKIKEFIATLKQSNFTLSVEKDKLILKCDKKTLSKNELNAVKSNEFIINYIKENKSELIEYISFLSGKTSIDKRSKNISAIYRLSGLQEGMLFHGLYDERVGAYTEQFTCDLNNPDLNHLSKSWQQVLKNHSILRSGFYYDAFTMPVQCVYKEVKLPVEIVDYSHLSETDQATAIKEFEIADSAKGFDFKSVPLMRITLLKLTAVTYRMLWTSHHILFDGWSLPILMEEFLTTYESIASGNLLIPKEEDKYEDYIRYLERSDKDAEESYWKNYMQGIQQSTMLPFIGATKERTKGVGYYRSLPVHLNADLTEKIQGFAKGHRLTVNTLMQGVWSLLLHQYTGSKDIVFGVIVSGRPDELPNVEKRVGMFINTLPLRSIVEEGTNLMDWLQEIQAQQVSSRQYQYSTLQQIQDWAAVPSGDMFDSILVFENYPVSKVLGSKKWSLDIDNIQINEQTNYPLTIFIFTVEKINLAFSYNTTLLEEETIKKIGSHFKNVLEQLVTNGQGHTSVQQIEVLTADERLKLLLEFNNTVQDYPRDKSIVALFEEQADKTPDAIAVEMNEVPISYKDLNERANQLAGFLVGKGVINNMLVPVCIERSHEMIIAILAVLKTGAAFVPVDPDFPLDRINYMLNDSAAKLVVSNSNSMLKLNELNGLEIIRLDKDWPMINKESSENLHILISPRQLAYVIHTSGSTGMPKGVMIEHGSVVNLLKCIDTTVAFTANSAFLSVTTFSFDICYLEFFLPLVNGGRLILITRYTAMDGYSLADAIHLYCPTHMQATPATWQLLLDASWQNKESIKILIGGEAIKEEIKDALTEIGEVYNLYGPTETTIWSVCKKLEREERVLIGKPLANTDVFITTETMKLVPIGVIGEICIGGAGLARGYLNRSDLTEQKFINNPFTETAGSRIYKTGDMGRWLPDGNLECLGRIDDQVKIRGHRIELGEIETVLIQSELIHQAVVIAKEVTGNNKKLVGYYVPRWEVVKAREQELYKEQVGSWKEIYESEYTVSEPTEDEEFDINIWKNSFTGNPIPVEQMQEWLQDIIGIILSEKTGTVLEIGSGTGLVFYQLAGKVSKYIGTDFSKASIDLISRRIQKGLKDYGPTELMVVAAHEVSLPPGEEIDTIVMNSVVQYFPGEHYMNEVIEKCILLLNGKGRIVIGDVRDNRLLELFKGRLILQQMGHSVNIREFKWAVDQEILKEEELCFNPAYFYQLPSKHPAISHVEITWKDAESLNELTLYRYNVVLQVGKVVDMEKPDWQDFNNPATFGMAFQQLKDNQPMIALKNVTNFRLWQENLLKEALEEQLVINVGELVSFISKEAESNQSIKQLLKLAQSKNYHIRLLLDEDPLKINIVMEARFSGSRVVLPLLPKRDAMVNYTNVPLFSDISLSLQKDLKLMLKQRLPDYMIPSELIALIQLPLTNNGKIDRRFLSLREEKSALSKLNFQPPATEVEQNLAIIWEELLDIGQVGIHDNFFELGGHSLLAMRLVSAIRKQMQIEIAIKALFDYPTIATLATHLHAHHSDLLLPPIQPVARPERIPLSFSQERLWFIDQLEGSVQYHLPTILKLNGMLNIKALTHALQQIVERHEVLRTVIIEEEGQVFQKINSSGGWSLPKIDRHQFNHKDDALQNCIAGLVGQPFDLSKDYMLRATLVHLDAGEFLLVLVIHHIASDGWSNAILVKEILSFYKAFNTGIESKLSLLPIQYPDFAIWQRAYMAGNELQVKLLYWKDKLQGVLPLQLPTDYPRPAVQSFSGSKYEFIIDDLSAARIRLLGKQQGTTVFMTLLAAFKVLLHRYSRQEDICVGIPIAGRQQQEVEGLIGCFVNTLALRDTVKSDSSFISLLQQVKKTTLAAYEHQDLPFEKLVEELIKNRDLSHSAIFQVMFDMQNNLPVEEIKLGNLEIIPIQSEHNNSKFDLSFSIAETENGLKGMVEYCTDLYHLSTICRMVGHFNNLLKAIVTNPNSNIAALNMMDEIEVNQLLKDFNNTQFNFPSNQSIVEQFEQQVSKSPDAIALVMGEEKMSYAELNCRSNQLAHYLKSKAVALETLVPFCIERGFEMIIAMLGILKSGAAYVPIDFEYPPDRITFIMEDIKASIVITSGNVLGDAAAYGVEYIRLDRDHKKIAGYPTVNISNYPAMDSLAYVMYTSGSTGQPKGVMIQHNAMLNYVMVFADYFSISPNDFVLQQYSVSFDTSIEEIYPTLINGGIVCIIKEGGKDVETIKDYIESNQATILSTTPMVIAALNRDLTTVGKLRFIISGGDVLSKSDIGFFLGKVKITNGYGPTESTIAVTYNTIKDIKQTSLIGKPIGNTQIYVLDNDQQMVPIGVPGELFAGGIQVARGYFNRSVLTAERFLKNSVEPESSYKIYKTGDLARWLPDGNIEYFGRVDNQVKIRGYRVELDEIEFYLKGSNMVIQAVVLTRKNNSGELVLVAYLVPSEGYTKEALINYLKTCLPAYMVPVWWIVMPSLPVTENGKVNKKLLQQTKLSIDTNRPFKAPRNQTEIELCEIWAVLLAVEKIGIDDNFFELGGHSLLGMRLIAAIRSKMGIDIKVKDLFNNPTIALLGIYIGLQTKDLQFAGILAKPRPQHIPLSFSQERLWFIDKLEGSVHYHIPAILNLSGDLDIDALNKSIQAIVNRHEVLRTVIREENGIGYQFVQEPGQWSLDTDNVIIHTPEDTVSFKEMIAAFTSKPFDLANDYMIRGKVITLDKQTHVLILTVHHISFDGWSLSVFVKELAELYKSYIEKKEPRLVALPIQYVDYAIWQRNYLQGEIMENKLNYWKSQLSGITPLELPVDHPRSAIQSTRGAIAGFTVDNDLVAQLQLLSLQHGTSMFMTLLSVFNVLLYRYSGQQDICVGTPTAGRQHQQVEALIGFFINTLAIRSNLSDHSTFTSLLQQVRSTTLAAYDNQEIPFEKVVEAVVKERDRSRSPLFQVMFVLQNTPEVPALQLGDVQLSPEAVLYQTSKFELTFNITQTSNGLQGAVEYSTDLFTEQTISSMILHFIALLQSVVVSPTQQIGKLPMLSAEEKQRLLVDFNDTHVEYPGIQNIISKFEEQVSSTPDAIALFSENETLTYIELNERSNQLAHYLVEKGAKLGTLVPISVERTVEMVISVLAVIKAGGVYVPVDPEYPEERISYMLEDTRAALVISDLKSKVKIPVLSGLSVLEINGLNKQDINNRSVKNLLVEFPPDHLVYVIYTSGSTGRPKGVKMGAKGMFNLLNWQEKQFVNKQRRVLQFASLNFDVSFQEIFSTLCFGSTLYLIDGDIRRDLNELLKYINRHQITHLFVPYIVLKNLVEHIDPSACSIFSVQEIIVAGEQLKLTDDIKSFLKQTSVKIVNQYGPTEAHVVSSYTIALNSTLPTLPPIGKPIDNTQLYILGNLDEPVPVGVQGELFIGGVQVAHGYLNLAELTGNKFLENPFNKAAGQMLYKTGDLARWRSDGNIEYLGRKDDQVKIRGYRVELGEIESIMQQTGLVRQSVVLAKEDKAGNKRLIGYIVPEPNFDAQAMLAQLNNRLPAYMVPALWMKLESLPITPNGKIDKNALPDPDASELISNEYIAPRNDLENKLAIIWQELLQVDRVGIHDNFFELGGHSLLTMRMVSAIEKKLLVSIPVNILFQFTSISELGKYLEIELNEEMEVDENVVFEKIII